MQQKDHRDLVVDEEQAGQWNTLTKEAEEAKMPTDHRKTLVSIKELHP
jgi:hypothetical protein